MTKEEKEKIKKSYESILENFPFDKYDDIIDNIRKLFDHPSAKRGLLKYVKEELVDKNNV
tara:strand:- start:481 stop:660 length:180 start_codon:yes stop_codon:yes gene_type:complete